MKRPRLPKTVKVGAHEYRFRRLKVVKHDDGTKCFGLTDTNKLVIELEKGIPQSRELEAIVHELLHACLDEQGIDEEIEEKVVTTLAPKFLQVLRDNPELVEYLRS